MDNLNDLVWSTSNPKPSSNSNGQGRLSPSSSNIGNNKSGSLPFNSAPHQGVSPQKQPFGSYGQKTLNPSINTASSTSPRSFSPSNSLPRKPPLDKVSNDPFENLVNLGGSAKKSSTAGLSLEEQRKLQLEKQKTQTLGSSGRSSSPADQHFWEQLGSKSPNSTPKSVPLSPSRSFSPSLGNIGTKSNKQSNSTDPFDDLLSTNSITSNKSNLFPPKRSSPLSDSKPVAANSTLPIADPWNLDFLEKSSDKVKNETTSLVDDDPFGLNAFTNPSTLPVATSSKVDKPTISKRDSNPLGALASPALPNIKVEEDEESSSEEYMEEEDSRSFNGRGKSASVDADLDHLIAQVMEMGFEPEQARSALELSNKDVQAAIDILVENRNAEEEIIHDKRKNIPSLPRKITSASRDRYHEDYNQVTPAWKAEKSTHPSKMNWERQESGEGSGFDMASFQVHKEKFISNASTIGASVLSKANFFMKQASEKIRESIDDIQQRAENFQGEEDKFKTSGKPRWMQSHSEEYSSDEDMNGNHGEYRRHQDTFIRDENSTSPKQERFNQEELWDSTHRIQSQDSLKSHRAPPKSPVPPKNRTSPKTSTSPKPPVAPKPKRPPRPVVPATPEQLQQSDEHKTAGNDKFKLGQFGGAEQLYSEAIASLPANHDNLILLYNNRAAARIKVGDYNGVISDCDQVEALLGDDYLFPSPSDPFNFKDQLIKATLRRASANESKEKYEVAQKDFNRIISMDPNNKTGLEGIRRCQKAIRMMNGEATSKSPISSSMNESSASADLFTLGQPVAATAQAYSPTFGAHLDEFGFATIPAASASTSRVTKEDLDKSEAVSRLRAQDRFAEQEEEEKLRINDMVEDRLNQWKSNKVGNLRAMIASLDSILWQELNWKPCGLQDLIQPNQVKSKYMRAIAKLHPDKLSTNESVEHKLLASGIFSTLNEAWDQFKAQNGL